MFTKRHTRQRLVIAGLTVAALLTGALLVRTELIEKTLELGRVRQGDRHRKTSTCIHCRTRPTGICGERSNCRTRAASRSTSSIARRPKARARWRGKSAPRCCSETSAGSISAGLEPGILLGHPNRYFDGMVDIVNRDEGAVNKYNGDNIPVLWSAPLEVKEQAPKAVECALEMERWIVSEREKGGPDVSFGFAMGYH